ncbi:MAG: TIGR01777 family oxidoreductase, partial [Bacteroidetes bacterium]|nr:TIGR01777 family oxidoreductase [Bacteroidota bacterium]
KGLTDILVREGHEVTVLSRDAEKARAVFDGKVKAFKWRTDNEQELVKELEGIEAFVNLAGENIGSSLWTESKRNRILESRLSAGKLLTNVIASMRTKPVVLLQASAVGYYGSRGEEILDETSAAGKGFLAEVVRKWEDSTKEVESPGVRRVIIRSGVVFASNSGALPKLAMPYRLFLGTVMGSGKQWVPWIHYSDELEAIRFLLINKSASGLYNLVSPNPARMSDVCSAIGKVFGRPTVIHIPGSLLKSVLGKMAEETILTSQRVSPSRLVEAGFEFRYASIKTSIRQIFSHGDGE